jgi:hypothetical protein
MKIFIDSLLQRLKRAFRSPAPIRDGVGSDLGPKPGQQDDLSAVVITTEERSRKIESLLLIVEERTRTLEYVARQSMFAVNHQVDFLQRLYVESMPRLLNLNNRPAFNAAGILDLKRTTRTLWTVTTI